MRVVDMHCDTILELLSRDLKGKEASLYSNDLSIDLEKMKKISDSDWERILKFHKDKTGYEWCINDLSVNDFYYKETYSNEEQKIMLSVAMNVLEIWGNKLKELFSDKMFCLYLSITEDPFFLNLRFHTYREETEFIWGEGVDGIDKIEQPIVLRIV